MKYFPFIFFLALTGCTFNIGPTITEDPIVSTPAPVEIPERFILQPVV